MTTNLSASVLARLLNLAKQRGDDYNLLLNRFALERLLCRVAASPYADRFLPDTVTLLRVLLWPPTQVAATGSTATAAWKLERRRWS